MSQWWSDALLHLTVGYPIYQILGTIRHELAHAITYWLSGYGVKDFRVFPFRDKDGTWYWGRVMPDPKPGAVHSVHMHLAPYYACLISVIVWFMLASHASRHDMLLDMTRREYNIVLAITISTLVSPVVDTIYNLYKHFVLGRGDFTRAVEYLKFH